MVIARIFTRIGSLIYCKPQNKDTRFVVHYNDGCNSCSCRLSSHLNDSNTLVTQGIFNAIHSSHCECERNRVSLIAFEKPLTGNPKNFSSINQSRSIIIQMVIALL